MGNLWSQGRQDGSLLVKKKLEEVTSSAEMFGPCTDNELLQAILLALEETQASKFQHSPYDLSSVAWPATFSHLFCCNPARTYRIVVAQLKIEGKLQEKVLGLRQAV